MAKKKKSAFRQSFGRELGKNTGRFVSNKVFGDKHASKSKIIHDGKIDRPMSRSEVINERERIKSETELAKLQHEKNLLKQQEEQNRQEIIESKIEEIVEYTFPDSVKELAEYINRIEINLKANTWGSDELNNKYADALFEKYSQGIDHLELINANKNYIDKLKAKLKKFKKKRFWTLNSSNFWMLGLFIFMIIIFIVYYK